MRVKAACNGKVQLVSVKSAGIILNASFNSVTQNQIMLIGKDISIIRIMVSVLSWWKDDPSHP